MKQNRKRIIVILSTMVLAFLGLIFQENHISVNAINFTDDFFRTENVVLTTNQTLPKETGILDYRSGILATASKNKSRLNLNDTLSGKFTIDMMAYSSLTYGSSEYETRNYSNPYQDLNSLSLEFTDVTNKNSFKVVLNGGAPGNSVTTNAHVEVENQKMGINYFRDSEATGNTTGANARGVYTFLWGTGFSNMAVSSANYSSKNMKSIQIEFDPLTMCVYGYSYGYSSYDGKKILIWDLSQEINDGRYTNFTLNGFEQYKVSVVFESIAKERKANLLIYNINGQSFENSLINNSFGPNLYVKLPDGNVGQKYNLKTPLAYDVIDGATTFNGECIVYNEKGQKVNLYDSANKLLTGKYVEGAYFVPESSGQYTILYTAYDSDGLTGETLESKINVFDENAIKLIHDLKDEFYLRDSLLTLPKGKFYFQNQEFGATVSVSDPENKQVKVESGQIRFTKEGRYTFNFSSNLPNGKYEEEVQVYASAKTESLFENQSSDSIEFGKSNISSDLSGIIVTSTLNNASIRYKNPIDFKKMTKNDLLVEFIALPKQWGSSDFEQITIKLIDADDASNYVLIVSSASENEIDTTYLRAGSANQKLAGLARDGRIVTSTGSGTPTLHSFSGQSRYQIIQEQTVEIYFDYATKSIYTANNKLVADLDDSEFFSTSWNGFKNDRAYLEIQVSGLNNEGAKYLVKNIDGLNIEKNIYLDKVVPEMVYDESLFVEGLTGTGYPLPNVKALDKIAGELPVTVNVFFEGSLVEVKNGVFVPKTKGKYLITYTASDSYGNRAILEKLVNVLDEIEPLEIEIEGNIPNGFVGTAIQLPTYSATGGSGKVSVNVKAIGLNTGTEYEIGDLFFTPYVADLYTITYTAFDRLGNQRSSSFATEVVVSKTPIIQAPTFIPEVLIAGVPTEFFQTKAMDYNKTPAEEVDVVLKLILEGKEITLGKETFVPSFKEMNTTAILRYSATSKVTGKTATLDYEIPAVRLYDDYERLHIEQYFLTEGIAAIDSSTNYIDFTTDNSGASLAFLKEVAADGFQIVFNIPASANNVDRVTIRIKDAANPVKSVKFDVKKANSQDLFSYLIINDTETTTMAGTFYGTTAARLNLYYDNTLFSISDNSGLPIAHLKNFEDGTPFTGFSSTVNFEIVLGEVTGITTFRLHQIGNQLISSVDDDYTVPSITLLGEMVRSAKLNDKITIPDSVAYDVLSFETSLSIRVLDPDDQLIYSSNNGQGTKIQITKYGTYYVTYLAKDGKGNNMTLTRAISVLDSVAPEITLNGKVPATGKLGSKINLPNFTATDNYSTNIDSCIFVITPDNVMSVVENNVFIASEKGKYTIRYFAIDEAGNLNYMDYVIEVK